MRKIVRLGIVAFMLFLSAGVVLAQHNHAAMSSQTGQQASGNDTMTSCQKHGAETMAALDKLDKTLAAGRETNDPTRMKAALDQAQKQLAEARHHMSMCPMLSGSTMQHGDMNHIQHMQGMPEQASPESGQKPR